MNRPAIDTTETLDVKGAAALMRCGVEAVEQIIDTGALPALQINQKRTVLLRVDVLAYIAQHAREQAEQRRKQQGAKGRSTAAPIKSRQARPRQVLPDLSRYESRCDRP
ncbi:MAG: hypothetical protein BGP10_15805 [Rhodanobacter sp. 68-29]|nr:hypothetical protein [Rhodanobacter sp.]ODV27861.1 MAG: hypothetical protein ABT19_01375 [Rhodanobacter sp. SCN 68-63]OJY61370.1 MAG: hypothetical protein BGP10_15805 [Rhodanobacter sp. 68-29]